MVSKKNQAWRNLVWLAATLAVGALSFIFPDGVGRNAGLIVATVIGLLPTVSIAIKKAQLKESSYSLAATAIVLVLALNQSWTAAWLVSIGSIAFALITEQLRAAASRSIDDWLLDAIPLVRILKLHRESLVSFEQVKERDRVVVRAGERIPVDGFLLSSRVRVANGFDSTLEESLTKGDPVIAGSRALDDLSVEAIFVGQQTSWIVLSKIIKRVLNSKSAREERWSRWLFWAQSAWSILVIVWFFAVDGVQAVWLAVAGLLWLGVWLTELVNKWQLSSAMSKGLIFKDWSAIFDLKEIEVALIDKTGTLTMGWLRLVEIMPSKDLHDEDVVRLASALEQTIDHPISRTLMRKAQAMGLPVPSILNQRALTGLGVAAEMEGETFALGSIAMVESMNIEIPSQMLARGRSQEEQGATVIYLIKNKEVLGMFVLMDILRSTAQKMVMDLKAHGVEEIQLISGDVTAPVEVAAKSVSLGKESVWANLSPLRKVDHIKKLADRKTLALADPASDREVLKHASVGVSFLGQGPVLADASSRLLIRVPDISYVGRAFNVAKVLRSWNLIGPPSGIMVTLAASALALLLI